MKTSSAFSLFIAFIAAAATADPATGWLQTAEGTYDYNDTANWVGGEINGVFGSDLTLAGNQMVTFGADTALPDSLQIDFAGGKTLTFASVDSTVRTLTLGGDIAVGASVKSTGVTFESTLAIDLGGADRAIASTSGNATLKFLGTIDNGALTLANVGPLYLNVANTYAGGTQLQGTGKVYVAPNAFGTGTVTFEAGASLDVGAARTFTVGNPLVFNGNWTFGGTSGNLDLGSGPISVTQPVTINITKNTLLLRGDIVDGDLFDITKAGSGTLATYQDYALDGEAMLCSTAGTWQFNGVLSGSGTLYKTGAGSFEPMTAMTFTDLLVIREGTVRFRAKNTLASGTRVLIEKDGVLRSNTAKECNYAYSAPNLLASGAIDPASNLKSVLL